jgi:preprotein translocase subunit SecD
MTQPNPARPAPAVLIVGLLAALVVLALVVVGIAAGLVIRDLPKLMGLLTPTTAVTFRASAGDHPVTAAELENGARILTDRARAAGYAGASFAAAPGGQIEGRVPTRLDAAALSRLTGIGLVELVDLGQNPMSAGTLIRTDLPSLAPQTGEGLIWHTIISNDGFKSAVVGRTSTGEWQVNFTLTEKGTKILADFTTQHIGTTVGIALDKQIISSPRIQEPIPDGRGQILGGFTQESAQDLAAIITTQPLPVRLEPAAP